jgi:tetratricopeptide (TPR) repeat protein
MRRVSYCILMMLSLQIQAQVNPALDSAAVYFESGQYDTAIAIWQNEAEQQISSALFYNLGLAYKQSGKPLEALYSFEQALRLKPWSAAIREQLSAIRAGITEPVIPVQPFFLQVWLHHLVAMLRPGAWAMLSLLFMMVLVLHFISIQKPDRIKPFLGGRLSHYSGAIVIVTLVLAGISYARLSNPDEALTIALCEIRQGPAQESPVLRSLAAGNRILAIREAD